MLVSGPVVAFRMENSKGHPIYLFGDLHIPLGTQNECHINESSKRIDEILKRKFTEDRTKKIGLFVEAHYSDPKIEPDATENYIRKMVSLLQHNLVYGEEGKIQYYVPQRKKVHKK